MFANYAYTDAKITKDNNPVLIGLVNSGAVRHTANLFGRYTFANGPVKGLALGGGLAHSGPVSAGLNYNDNTFAGYLPGRTTFEANLGYVGKKMYVNLNVYNLTNKRYITSGYINTGNDWLYTPAAPRNFRLGVGFNL
jgi:iron complex outermembrane receptor protein